MTREWSVAPDEAGVRLDKFLAASDRLGSRARAAQALDRGKVFVNGVEARLDAAATRLAAGDIVGLWVDRPGTPKAAARPPRTRALGEKRDLPIVFEDDAIIVLNKPAGVLAVPLARKGDARSVYTDLARYLGRTVKRRPFVVHRIDRDTSGLVVFAKHADVQQRLKEQFKRHEAVRVYHAIVYGRPQPFSGTWRDHLVWDDRALIQKQTHAGDPRGQEAVSEYRVIEELGEASLIEVRLVTGKRNQIRLQAGLRGHSLVGEQRYVYGAERLRPIAFRRQALHAFQLAFRHPVTNEPLAFEAPLAGDMKDLIARLRRRSARRRKPDPTSR